MKTLVLLLSVLFTTMSFAQVPNYVPANGLVGWWPFNGNANDESGNGNNGSNNGATLTTDRNGVANQAYSFDGIDDYISILRNYQGSFTTSIWFNSNGNSQYKPLIDAFDVNWEIQIIDSFLAYVSFDNSSNYQVFNSSVLITNNNWNNLICTYNSSILNFYLNGTQIDQFTVNTLPINSGNYFLGASLTGSDQYFEGKLDDIGIWNRVLTTCEIQNLYTSTNPTNLTSQTACNSYTWNGQTYTESGTYTGITANCVTESLDLTITPSSTNTTSETACDSYTWNGQTYTASGVYTGTTSNCVTESLNLTITQTFSDTTIVIACDSYTWNGTTYTESGTYTGITENCITQSLKLTINPSTSSSISQTALDSYTWLVNNQTYTTTGAYTAVIPNASGCDSTITLNLTMSFTGINDLSTSKLSVYPNPTNGDFTITGLELLGTVSSLKLTDMNGKVVKVLDTKATKFSMSLIKPGVYFLNIISGNKEEVLKIVKE